MTAFHWLTAAALASWWGLNTGELNVRLALFLVAVALTVAGLASGLAS